MEIISKNLPEGLRKIMKMLVRIVGFPVEIRNKNFQKTSLELYLYACLFGDILVIIVS
jgi:hypothetical protein